MLAVYRGASHLLQDVRRHSYQLCFRDSVSGCNAPFRTLFCRACLHLYCPSCAEKHFSIRMVCPLCSKSVAEDGDLVELNNSPDLSAPALATFSLACLNLDVAMKMVLDAVVFCRTQTALSGEHPSVGQNLHPASYAGQLLRPLCRFTLHFAGTREVFMRATETDVIKRRLVETENKLNTVAVSGVSVPISMICCFFNHSTLPFLRSPPTVEPRN